MKVLIIGHARHGKDTAAKAIQEVTGMTFCSSSQKAAEIFLFDALKDKYGYKSFQECFEDRMNRRKEWHDLISEYNQEDPARLAKDILRDSDIYVGMRSNRELQVCANQGLFDIMVGIFDPRKPLESKESFDIDLWKWADVVIPNSESIEIFELRVKCLFDSLRTDRGYGKAV